ncbi:heterokaryon incompatibility protein-domain-containing protein [Podospora australis]|uniref:Heterokaryon incompatibility protein-domain-containing protein n=1 Tax=Podospora australis TaxID=1536484 RepID=A0AAN6WR23_9PEZI|nr:heterokaryon incompatibility protein-domain-containing protein [Podospora australis]
MLQTSDSETTFHHINDTRGKHQRMGSHSDSDESWVHGDDWDESTEDPSYRDTAGTFDVGTRAWRFRQRVQRRTKYSHPWRHFWLPRLGLKKQIVIPKQTYNLDDDDPIYDDSEDETPVRRRLGTSRRPHVPTLEHQLRHHDEELPLEPEDTEYHSCCHCNRFIVDMRRHVSEPASRTPDFQEDPAYWYHAKGRDIGFNLAQITAAAANGCNLFAFLIRMASFESDMSSWDSASPIRVRFDVVNRIEGPTMSFHGMGTAGPRSRGDRQIGNFEIFTFPGTKPLHQYLGPWKPPNLVPNSKQGFARARAWIERCQRHHQNCKLFNTKYMPKRLLEITREKSDLQVRLVNDPEPTPYAILSYCWGGDQPAKTTMARLPDYQADIPLSSLPQTIQDAVTVTSGIGLTYLWVDAMCIIQDSDDDKTIQISQMHQVYRGALLTIAASATKTSLDGFLGPRDGYFKSRLRARLDDNVFGDVLVVPSRVTPDYGPSETLPLYTRGWTYQESQLSTRILAYGARETAYACIEAQYRDGGRALTHNRGVPAAKSAAQLTFSGLDPGNHWVSHLAHPTGWRFVVMTFSLRAITDPGDKLLAVAAIAEYYGQRFEQDLGQHKDRYLAGMWKENLLYDCLWSVKQWTPSSYPAKYRAPSWSWAAVEGVIEFYLLGVPEVVSLQLGNRSSERQPRVMQCELLEVKTKLYAETSPYGAVTGGFMRIRARARLVVWVRKPDERSNTGNERLMVNKFSYGWAKDDDRLSSLPEKKKQKGDNRLDFLMDVIDEYPPSQSVTFWCVEVYTQLGRGFNSLESKYRDPNTATKGPNVLEAHGLVLQAVNDVEFRRVGVMRAQGFPTGDSDFERWPYWFDDGLCELREFNVV